MRYNALKELMASLTPDCLPEVLYGVSLTFGTSLGHGATKWVYSSPRRDRVYKHVCDGDFLREVSVLYEANSLGVPVALPLEIYPGHNVFTQERLHPFHEASDAALQRFALKMLDFPPRVYDLHLGNIGYSQASEELLVHDCAIDTTTPPAFSALRLLLKSPVLPDGWHLCEISVANPRTVVGCVRFIRDYRYLNRRRAWRLQAGQKSLYSASAELQLLRDLAKSKGIQTAAEEFFASATPLV